MHNNQFLNQLTEEEFERKNIYGVSAHWCFFKDLQYPSIG